MTCTQCGSGELQPGFIEATGDGAWGYGRWIEGALELGVFGSAKRFRRRRWTIDAYRCVQCSHLELFVRPPE